MKVANNPMMIDPRMFPLRMVRVGELGGCGAHLCAASVETVEAATATKYRPGRAGEQMPAHPRTAKEQRVKRPTTM
jgi:hypothetical protein